MAVKLRLMRMGKKKQPTYRVVAADSRSPRNGRFLEIVGTYDPRQDPSLIEIDDDKALRWLQNGALPTETVEKLLKINGTWSTFTGEAPPAPLPPKADKVAPTPAPEPEPVVEDAPAEEPVAEEAPAEEPAAAEAAEEDAPADDTAEDAS